MKQLLCGLAMLPLLSAAALAQPATLSENQMDTISAGWSLYEVDCSNTSATVVSVYSHPGATKNPDVYLNIQSDAISITSAFGPCCRYTG